MWYYSTNEATGGPYSELTLRRLHDKGIVKDSTLVWSKGMDDWKPFKEVFNQFIVCPSCRTVIEYGGNFCPQCGYHFVEEKTLRCPTCNTMNDAGSIYCENCHRKLSETQVVLTLNPQTGKKKG